MRIIILIALVASVTALKAQTFIPGSFIDNNYRGTFANNIPQNKNNSKKWSVTRYSALSTSFTFFNGGNATVVAAPIGLQLNRKLNNNINAFAGVSLAPAYVNFNQSFMTADFNKSNQNNAFNKFGSVGLFSRAELGLQYVNDEKTFSISGSIGVERSSYPILEYRQNNAKTNQIISKYR